MQDLTYSLLAMTLTYEKILSSSSYSIIGYKRNTLNLYIAIILEFFYNQYNSQPQKSLHIHTKTHQIPLLAFLQTLQSPIAQSPIQQLQIPFKYSTHKFKQILIF
jgi:hypothetical protein